MFPILTLECLTDYHIEVKSALEELSIITNLPLFKHNHWSDNNVQTHETYLVSQWQELRGAIISMYYC